MYRQYWHLARKWLIGLAPVALFTAALPAQDFIIPDGPTERTIRRLPKTIEDVLVVRVAQDEPPAETKADEYWLGVQIAPLPELVRQQLDLQHGLVVGDIVADSPAAKAGLKRNDILLTVNGAPQNELADLVKAVEASDGKEMALVVLRGGKQQTLTATAEKRPVMQRVAVPVASPELSEKMRRVEGLLKELRTEAGGKGLGLYFPRPGVVAPRAEANRFWQEHVEEKAVKAEFPKDLSVRINKEGDQPLTIHVKKGDQEWDVTEDKLGELPADIRSHVQKMISQAAPIKRGLFITPEGKVEGELRLGPAIAAPPAPPAPPAAPRAPVEKSARVFSYRTERGALDDSSKLDAILKKLDSIDRLEKELRDLRKEVDGLRQPDQN